ncbi:hypothetical protein JHK86_006826 [Glycine max]|nr:hypothetical protein JHK86_006826 [Glycine max]
MAVRVSVHWRWGRWVLVGILRRSEMNNFGDQRSHKNTLGKESDKIIEIELKIKQLSFEIETARREEEEMRSKTQELKQEAEKSKAVAEELEKKIELYLKQTEGAKAS